MKNYIKRQLNSFKKSKERDYSIEGMSIKLPADHKLDFFQNIFPKYDKFIITISQNLPSNTVVIDVGANIGDSSVLFLKKNHKTICIEPTTEFFRYLNENINKNHFTKNSILVKKFISNSKKPITINLADGTANINKPSKHTTSENTGTEDIIPLNDIQKYLQAGEKISLVKIDTDGYDYSVIDSGLDLLEKHQPMLYFENLIDFENVFAYTQTYQSLFKKGYQKIWIFDNTGNLLISGGNWDVLSKLNHYLLPGNSGKISYYDVLTCCKDDENRANDMILKYFNKYEPSLKKELLISLGIIH